MASGWAADGAENEQIEATINDAIERAKRALPQGESLTHCEERCPNPRSTASCDARVHFVRALSTIAVNSISKKLSCLIAVVVKIANCAAYWQRYSS